jgi:hypothetical protein
VLTWAIAAYRADLGSRPCWALKECPARGKIYENCAFTIFRCEPIDFIEEKNQQKVIHSQFISISSSPETHHFGGTQVVQINI